MNRADVTRLLDGFRGLPAETEWLDFKEAKQSFDMDELGKYVSALANEANLHEQDGGWLVFGVKDKRDAASGLRPVVGSSYKASAAALNELKLLIAQGTSPSITFTQIFEVPHADCAPGSRVLVFQIPPAPRGQPIAWKGHFYGRAGESLVALGSKFEAIRMQSAALDWTAYCVTTDWSCLSSDALARGRALYALKHPRRADEVSGWSHERFLAELRLARNGSLTRAALLLFGQPGAVAALGDVSPRLTWQLLTERDEPLDYQHFGLPFALAVDEVVAKIRIHTVRILPPGQLAPLEVPNYDAWVIREALLNCIAHQDYALGGRVQIKESPSALLFSNAGAFIPGTVEQVLDASHAVHLYRNPCLADAMVELGLIDTIGSGIKRMYRTQRERHFPMPDFEIALLPPTVSVRIHGREIDPAFTRALLSASSLTLSEVIALDHVQKQRPVDPAMVRRLRAQQLIEGRGQRLSISGPVARITGQEVRYTLDRGLDAQHYKGLVLGLLRLGPQRRRKINELLRDKLPDSVPLDKRGTYIKNLLQEMAHRDQTIETDGGQTQAARWRVKSR